MKKYIPFIFFFLLFSCSEQTKVTETVNRSPLIYPDYTDVTIPCNIAPLNFRVEQASETEALFQSENYRFTVRSADGEVRIPPEKWKKLLMSAVERNIEITVTIEDGNKQKRYLPFGMHIAPEPIDAYLAYRLIEPGYTLWNQMGIYQRNLTGYEETPIYENRQTDNNCVNCHSFCRNNPDRMLFHLRASHAGTVLVRPDEIEVFDTKTKQTISPLVYPSWHPSGKYIAFSVNKTTQDFHPVQRVEVYDMASDVVVYDIEKRTILASPLCFSPHRLETFPSFSADGKTLFFCTAPALPLPDSISRLRYHLCSLPFDAASGRFGTKIDTLYNAEKEGKSVSFPRMSPDGKFLLCTLSAYGTFPIWHKDADLYMIDPATKRVISTEIMNSKDTESYHSWSSNSRWVVFSSRRLDGLYTRPYISYVSEDGVAGKPFLLPQKEASYYTYLMKSYNIPEFIVDKVQNHTAEIRHKARRKESSASVAFLLEK